MKKALTTHDIAKYCNVTPRTVAQWINEGKIEAYRTPGKHARVQKDQFLNFCDEFDIPVPDEFKKGEEKVRILIVDDDKAMVESIKRALAPEKEYSVDFAYDGFEAGQKFITHKPDLIILDIRMPKVDGLQLCSAIRADPNNSHVKIFVISGMVDDTMAQKVLKLGANDYLSKPFNNKVLKEKIIQYFMCIKVKPHNPS